MSKIVLKDNTVEKLLCKLTSNPYIRESIHYYKDKEDMYLFNGEIYDKQGIAKAYLETASRDIRMGFSDRMVGYYDKWYRYNHSDSGTAYDIGQRYASETYKCPDEVIFIEINPLYL